jgi:hypothetical protein
MSRIEYHTVMNAKDKRDFFGRDGTKQHER